MQNIQFLNRKIQVCFSIRRKIKKQIIGCADVKHMTVFVYKGLISFDNIGQCIVKRE